MTSKKPANPPKLRVIEGFGTVQDDPEALAKAKLESSGLTLEEGRQLGMSWHSADETRALLPNGWRLPSLQIDYFDPLRPSDLMRGGENWPAVSRFRALREPDPVPKDFAKYMSARDIGTLPYFPRNIKWETIISDYAQPIIITEGELKAAKACKEGFPTIGLGGVSSWQSKSAMGESFLHDLERVEWARRNVYLCFDSDIRHNDNVSAALSALADRLKARGALVYVTLLPPNIDGSKMGLDDFLVAYPNADIFKSLLTQSWPIAEAKVLWGINKQYLFVHSLNRILDRKNNFFIKPGDFQYTLTGFVNKVVLRKGGGAAITPTKTGNAWLEWPLRSQVIAIDYLPGLPPKEIIDQDGKTIFNDWPGWGCAPASGNVKPFLDLIDHLFTGAEEGTKTWFLQWLAYPLQHPGAKLYSSAVLVSRAHGVGKSLIGMTLSFIYGKDNFSEISQRDLHSPFTEWSVNKQMVMGDDVTGVTAHDKRADLDMIKKMITQESMRINIKYVPAYAVKDHCNYLWTTNQLDAFFLENDDRRFFVHEIVVPPLPQSFYDNYDAWYRDESKAGVSALFQYLLDLDMTGFNPRARAPATDSKEKMKDLTRSALGGWVEDLAATPDDMLKFGGVAVLGDLFTNRELMIIYCAWAGLDPTRGPSAKALAAELARAGIAQVHDRRPITVPGRSMDRYYAIRNRKRWAKADLATIQDHLNQTAGLGGSKY